MPTSAHVAALPISITPSHAPFETQSPVRNPWLALHFRMFPGVMVSETPAGVADDAPLGSPGGSVGGKQVVVLRKSVLAPIPGVCPHVTDTPGGRVIAAGLGERKAFLAVEMHVECKAIPKSRASEGPGEVILHPILHSACFP